MKEDEMDVYVACMAEMRCAYKIFFREASKDEIF
jgi:hypothetical protein